MTKPTILLLTVVYFASILIVGIFGMQIMSFNNINYIESITLTDSDDNLEFSANKNTLTLEEYDIDDAIPYKKYNATFRYKKGMTIKVMPIIKAKDPTLDPTDKTLQVSLKYESEGFEGCITYEEGIFKVNRRGSVIITYNSQDNSKKIMVLVLKAM